MPDSAASAADPGPRADAQALTVATWLPGGWAGGAALMAPLLLWLAWPGGAADFVMPRPLFLSLHTMLEVVSVVVSMAVGLTARHVLDERDRLFGHSVSAAFIVVATLDTLHLVTYAGMPDLVSPNTSHKAIVLWLLARLLVALALIAWCVPWRSARLAPSAVRVLVGTGLGLSVLLGGLAVWRPEVFPSTFEPGRGLTPLKQAAEALVMALLAVALVGQWRRMAAMDAAERADEAPVRDALLLMLLGESFFVVYGESVTTSANLFGHVYKVLAYACLYRSVFLQRVQRPYRRLVQARQEIEQRSAEYRELLELAPMGVVVTDQQGRVQLVNRALELMFGYPRGELVGQPVERLLPLAVRAVHEGHRTAWRDAGMSARHKRSGLQGRHKDGSLLDVEVAIARAPAADGWRVTACVVDVSHQRAYEAELEHRATHDRLTGLPNRWRFMDALQRAIAQAAATAGVDVALLDLSGFKQANVRHGNAVGDALLQRVAQALQDAVPAGGLVARMGSDVFGVIAPSGGDPGSLDALARRLAQALAPGVRTGTVEWPAAAAMGLASFPAHALDADRLLRCADVALHDAKRRGRAQVTLYDPALGELAQRELRVLARLQAALREHTLALHYQPQVDVASGRIHGFEALLRWHDAELGPVPPAAFVPVAERGGLIEPLGAAVLAMACEQLARWRDEGLHTRVAINLSPREFRQPGLVQRIAQALQHHALPAQALAVEVTESAVIDEPAAVAQQLQALVALGVQVHLDDFGTGHSSLAWLKAFPISTIKIDRSFVRDMVEDAGDEAIVRAVVGLAHTLSCSVVAEGVERPEQLARLQALGCEAYQGWLFSPAVPAAQAAALLQRQDAGLPAGPARAG